MICFAITYLWVGRTTAKNIKDKEDYFLSNRNLNSIVLALTLFASQLGAGAVLGSAEAGYKEGWIGLAYPFGMFFGLILLGTVFGPRLRALELTTVAQIFELKYKSPLLRKVASYFSALPLFFILVGQAVGARKFFHAIGVESNYIFLAIWLVFLAYVVLGGIKAIVKADIIQVSFILVVFLVAFIFITWNKSIIVPQVSEIVSSFKWSDLSCFLFTILYMGFEQDMGQKYFAAKSPKTITFAALLAASLILIASSLSVYFGVTLKQSQIALAPGQDALISSITYFTNPIITSCIACGTIMVIFSTTSSLLSAITSNIAFDLPFLNNKKLFMSRVITLAVGLAGILVSFTFQNILSLLLQAYEFSVCTLCPAIMMAVFAKKISKNAAILSMVVGSMSFLLLPQTLFYLPKEMISLILSFSGYFIGRHLFKFDIELLKAG
jgi:SSS family solute:Na+ symporter